MQVIAVVQTLGILAIIAFALFYILPLIGEQQRIYFGAAALLTLFVLPMVRHDVSLDCNCFSQYVRLGLRLAHGGAPATEELWP